MSMALATLLLVLSIGALVNLAIQAVASADNRTFWRVMARVRRWWRRVCSSMPWR